MLKDEGNENGKTNTLSLTNYQSFGHCYRQTTFGTNLDFLMPGTKLKICMIMYI